ncbi:MAG: lipid A-modifier LpxR family protein [bacterium]
MKTKTILILLLAFSYLPLSAESYLILNYDNDMVFNTDYYYSQGIGISYRSHSLNPIGNKLFPELFKEKITQISLNHKLFTPTNITGDSLSDFDRPYCGLLFFDIRQEQIEKNSNFKINFDILFGVIGPLAGGFEVQSFIHRQTENAPQPKGWENQISNGIILDGALQIEHLAKLTTTIENISTVAAEIGTLYNNVSIGSKIRMGFLDEYFDSNDMTLGKEDRDWLAFIVTNAIIKVNFYNSTLLGNFFFEKSPMVLPYKDMKLLTVNLSADMVLAYKSSRMELGCVYASREFDGGRNHAWFTFKYIQKI